MVTAVVVGGVNVNVNGLPAASLMVVPPAKAIGEVTLKVDAAELSPDAT